MAEHIWTCKIGGEIPDEVWEPGGEYTPYDPPMRTAVEKAYRDRFGVESEFTFSGWGGELDEPERAAVENREPVEAPVEDEAVAVLAALTYFSPDYSVASKTFKIAHQRACTLLASTSKLSPNEIRDWVDKWSKA